MATAKIDMPKNVKTLGYKNPSNVKLHVPYTFVQPPLPEAAVAHLVAAKPKPKAVPSQLSMTAFLKSN